jgi:hypothetical protein
MQRIIELLGIALGLIVVGVLSTPIPQQDCISHPCIYQPTILKPGEAATPTRTFTPTATPTRTATATPPRTPTATQVPVSLLDNGDFDQDGLHWRDTGGLIANALPVPAHSGRYALWLRSDSNGAEVDRLDVEVPVDKPYLSYWLWIRSTEPTCGEDRGGVTFSVAAPPLVDSFDLCTATATNGWVNHVVDLSAVAGQTGTLSFLTGAFDADLIGSELLIDDVGFRPVP